jgi:hypothetical protein
MREFCKDGMIKTPYLHGIFVIFAVYWKNRQNVGFEILTAVKI